MPPFFVGIFMALAIIGRKIGMTQFFDPDGVKVPVTIVEAGPCTVLRKKEASGKDGYDAVLLGILSQKEARLNKAEKGFFAKNNLPVKKVMKEVRVSKEELDRYPAGGEVGATLFNAGDIVDVTGYSKGRGFQGVVKRHNFAGFPKTHGTHEYRKHAGSIGSNTWPARTIPGKRMPGHYGNEKTTILNIKVLGVFPDRNLLFLQGAVPGAPKGVLVVRKALKTKKKSAVK